MSDQRDRPMIEIAGQITPLPSGALDPEPACYYCPRPACNVAHDARGCVLVCSEHGRWRQQQSMIGGHHDCPLHHPDSSPTGVRVRCGGLPVVTSHREEPDTYDLTESCGWEGLLADGDRVDKASCRDCGGTVERISAEAATAGAEIDAQTAEADLLEWLQTCLATFGLGRASPPAQRLIRQLSVLHDKGLLATDDEMAAARAQVARLDQEAGQRQAYIDEYERLRRALIQSPYVTLHPATSPSKVAAAVLDSLRNWQEMAGGALDVAIGDRQQADRLRKVDEAARAYRRAMFAAGLNSEAITDARRALWAALGPDPEEAPRG